MPDDADPLSWGEARAIEDHREVLAALDIHFDTWFSERSLVDVGRHGGHPGRPAGPRRGGRGRRRHLAAQHRLRRRQGPRAGAQRRRADLPAARHRLPPRQVLPGVRPAHRRVGRRPPRLRAPHEGGHAGRGPRSGRARGVDRAAGEPDEERRAGAPVQADRRHRRAARGHRRGRPRRSPAHLPAPVDRQPADLRPRRGHQPGHGQPRLLRPDGPRPPPFHRAAGRRAGGGPAGPRPGRPGPARPRARAGRPARPVHPARRAGHRLHRPGPASHRHLGARAGRRRPRLLPRLLRARRWRAARS